MLDKLVSHLVAIENNSTHSWVLRHIRVLLTGKTAYKPTVLLKRHPMRIVITVSIAIYVAFQVFLVIHLAAHGKADGLTIWNTVRPAAMLICFTFYLREGGKWPLWLVIWSGAGVVRFIMNLPAPALGYAEAASELFVAIPAAIAWRADPHRSYYRPSLLNRLRAWFIPSPQLIVIPLGTKVDDLFKQYKMVAESEEESYLEGCTHYEISLRDQDLTVAVDDGEVKGVIYRTENYGDSEQERVRKLRFYLEAHGQKSRLKFKVNNGFGFLYRSCDDETRAAYSYAADIFSISRFGYKMV